MIGSNLIILLQNKLKLKFSLEKCYSPNTDNN